MINVPFHELANIFPMMSPDEYAALLADMRASGYDETAPIVLYEGQILDGRNRWKAARELGIEPPYVDYDGDDPLGYVVRRNLNRRHLNETQRGTVAAKLANITKSDAGRIGGKHKNEATANLQLLDNKITQTQAADMLNVSPRTVATIKAVERAAPDLFEPMAQGSMTANEAMKEVRRRARDATPEPVVEIARRQPRLVVASADNTTLDAESVDLIITSPPYNLGESHWPMGGNGRTPRYEGIGYYDGMPEDEYQRWQVACLREFYRVAKPGASLFYNHKVRNRDGGILHPMDWLRNAGNPWTIRQEIIWDRGSTHNHSATLFWPEDERIYWMTKGNPELPNRPIGASTVWSFHGPVANTWHPAPFCEELPRRCMDAVGRAGITVLDPFAGSCTTLKVALELGYDAIGIDISIEYLSRAAKENGWTTIPKT